MISLVNLKSTSDISKFFFCLEFTEKKQMEECRENYFEYKRNKNCGEVKFECRFGFTN